MLRACLLCALLLFASCSEKPSQSAKSEPGRPRPRQSAASVTLRVAVAEDAALAEAIERLRGEWQELGGTQVQISQIEHSELLSDAAEEENLQNEEKRPQADLVIFASRYLGHLCEEHRLRPLRTSTLRSETLSVDDILPTVRETVMTYGGQPMALPIGCPVPLLLSEQKEGVPAVGTWQQLPADSASYVLSSATENLTWAYLLLARAACYAQHPSRDAILFDPDSMKPRLDSPPFVRALVEMKEMATADRLVVSDSVAAYLKHGELTALFWPSRPKSDPNVTQTQRSETTMVAPLPGTDLVWNPIPEEWEAVTSAPQRVTLLGTSGRLIGVSSNSRNAAAAFRLAAWLAGKQNARQLSTASPNVAACRNSLLVGGDDWLGYGLPGFGQGVSRAIGESLANRRRFIVPRLVRVDEYLDSLGAAVRTAASDDSPPEVLLQRACDDWEKLTDAVGRDRQRRAYLRHLGVEPYEAKTK